MSLTIEVLGHKVKFSRKDYDEYDNICYALHKNAPSELKALLKEMTEEEFSDLVVEILLEIDSRLE